MGISGFALQVVSHKVDDCVMTISGHKPFFDRGICKSTARYRCPVYRVRQLLQGIAGFLCDSAAVHGDSLKETGRSIMQFCKRVKP
jgi:hypothetical protein